VSRTGRGESDVERLLVLLRNKRVCRPEAVHGADCRYPREGKRHGPCTCGAQQLDILLRQALIDCGVSIGECPDEVRERLYMYQQSLTSVLRAERGASENGFGEHD